MRIDRLEVYYVEMPMGYTWKTAYGEDKVCHTVLVKAISGDAVGWSESSPFFAPTYTNESAGSVYYHVTEVFGPWIVGREYDTAGEINERLSIYKGNSFAKAAIEVAWWTLESSITGIPLHLLVGGTTREVVTGTAIGIEDSFDLLLHKLQEAVDAGYPRIKLKVAPGWDVEMLEVVRSAFPDITLHIDCNSAYTLDDLPMFRDIDRFNLAFIEQPLHFNDIIDHAELAKQIETPICLDESITSFRVAEQAIRLNSCKYINIKPWRTGGISDSIKVHDMARDAGIPDWLGGMVETGIAKAISIELATLENFTYPADLGNVSGKFEKDITDGFPEMTPRLTYEPFTGSLPVPNIGRLAEAVKVQKIVAP